MKDYWYTKTYQIKIYIIYKQNTKLYKVISYNKTLYSSLLIFIVVKMKIGQQDLKVLVM